MKIDYDLINDAPSSLNPLGDREICLRDFKIAEIENLILTKNQYDTIDLSANDLKKLENFPLLTRLKTLLASNNTIAKIDPSLGLKLPSLKTLVLTNNDLKQLGDIPVSNFKKLESLVLLGNPVSKVLHYREYLISNLESLKYLDFQKVTAEERKVASIMFQGAKGSGLRDKIVKTSAEHSGPSKEEIEKLKIALSQAKSLEEITILERQLQLHTGR